MPAKTLPTIPRADVESHNTSKSCYVTLGTKVYDVTSFIDDHPGGGDLILEYAGKDVSEIMTDEVSHFHSEAAYEILDENLIGFVATDPIIKAAVDSDRPDEIVPLPPSKTGVKELKLNGAAEELTARPVYASTGMSSADDLSKETDFLSDYKTHKFLDLNRPLFMQMWNGGFKKEFYLEQVHRPRHYKGGESAPLFGNFLEPLSKTAWYVVPTLWLPCVAYGTHVAYSGLSGFLETAAYWLTGLFIWTLVEYILHRCLFHLDK
jgi:4-hydroxysphinganine ceramide fatty acyl 2-hydroxylase